MPKENLENRTSADDLVRSLSELREGSVAVVVGFDGGRAFQDRIVSMGVCAGAEITVLHGDHGPMVIRVGETRIALGHGMAQKVLVAVDPE